MSVGMRWLGIFTLVAVTWFILAPSERACAQTAASVVEPQASDGTSLESGTDHPSVAGLNLWTAAGRPRTFVDRETRSVLESIPIVERPNRPLHFYGNAVRRRHAVGSLSRSGH